MPVADHPASSAFLRSTKIVRPFVLIFVLLAVIASTQARSEVAATGIFTRRFCQMGGCDWVKALGSMTIYRDGEIKILTVPVASCHIRYRSDYLGAAQCSAPKVSQEAVVCSRKAPMFAFSKEGKWQTVQLSFTSISFGKALEYAQAQYFFYCHGVSRTENLELLVTRFGYRPNESEIENLDDWFEVESLIDLRAKAVWRK
ncbi:hypothetical protein [Methylocella sp. CPCC 101449]|uniref:hypothetical protein n=1 Tax=Methylocella sp. CPCC 101449 TaxID=2987531 RepID=UPI002890A5DF|nr:hypothetical protein [Methylocella sp. CPCC 101449]MDT2021197.1 hypothetical protein [Methylocella sp. CPCC 101449]